MKSIIFFGIIFLLVAGAMAQELTGTVVLKNGKEVTGRLIPSNGSLLVVNDAGSLRLRRDEIAKIFRQEKSSGKHFQLGANVFAGAMVALPSLPIGGIVGAGINVKNTLLNLSVFFHYGENEKTITWKKSERVISRTRGISYAVSQAKDGDLSIMYGKVGNSYDTGRDEESYMIGIMKNFGHSFYQAGYLHSPRGFVFGFGFKI